MKAGNLVKITRASIGTPVGAIGLIVEKLITMQDALTEENGFELKPLEIFVVQLCGDYPLRRRRYLWRDLEVLS